MGTPEFGKSFEHYILMELKAYQVNRNPELEIRFWRTTSGFEVDFVLNGLVGGRALARSAVPIYWLNIFFVFFYPRWN